MWVIRCGGEWRRCAISTSRLGAWAKAYWPWILIGLGVVLRAVQYFSGRSLWTDEASLALNIVERSYAELMLPLSNDQVCPPGFLWLSRAAFDLLGPSEAALRLPAFLFGLLSLPVFYGLCRRWTGRAETALALGIFAISGHLVAYSAELKQYSGDVLFSMLAFLLAGQGSIEGRRWLLTGLLGAAAVWFFHAVVFVLAGLCLVHGAYCLAERRWRGLLAVVAGAAIWSSSFLLVHRLTLSPATESQFLTGYWQASFAPIPPMSAEDVRWYLETLSEALRMPGGFPYPGVAFLPLFVGCVLAWRRSAKGFWLLVSPVLLALAASAMGKYPFADRLLLFTVPFSLLLIATGTVHIVRQSRGLEGAVGTILLLIILVPLALVAGRDILRPRTVEEVRPVVERLSRERRAGDTIYVFYGSRNPFRYYASALGIGPGEYTIGAGRREDPEAYSRGLEALRGKRRVWVVYCVPCPWGGVRDEQPFLRDLNAIGTRIDEFQRPGAALFLYDFTRPARAAPAAAGPHASTASEQPDL